MEHNKPCLQYSSRQVQEQLEHPASVEGRDLFLNFFTRIQGKGCSAGKHVNCQGAVLPM